ncbi:MAG: alginate lyase family protein [Clostridia bacterium]|nr:alginate lyase family protein [Clostridia bacterium]
MGTKLTDAKFFGELLDCTLPGLEEIPALAAKEDYAACRGLFAAYVRQMLNPERYFKALHVRGYYPYPEEEGNPAERAVKNLIFSCGMEWDFGEGPVDWFFNPTYNGYPEWTWQMNRHPEWRNMARAYRENGDETYAEVTARQLRSWIDQALPPEENVGHGATLCWRTIECGIRMGECWPEVIHTFLNSPAFTDDLLTDWCKSVWEHGDRLRRIHGSSNWLIMEMNGLAHIGVLYPCLKDAAEWLTYATNTLEYEMFTQIYPDGFQFELSTGYHEVVVTVYSIFLRLLNAYGVAHNPQMDELLRKALQIYVYLRLPDKTVPNINDGTIIYTPDFLADYTDIGSGDPVIRWGALGEGAAPAVDSYIFRNAGLAALRTGWGEDDTWLFFDGGPFGKAHQHEDKLNVLLYAGGYALVDSNNYSYDSSEMREYVLSTRGHNTVRVDGMDQNRRKTYCWQTEEIKKDSGLQSNLTETVDALRAVYNEGYGEDQDTSITHERSVYFFKKEAGTKPFAVIVDRLTADAEHDYEVLWHMNSKTLGMEGMQLHANSLRIFTPEVPMETAGLSISRGTQFPQWQGWTAHSMVQKDFDPVYTAQYWLHGQNMRWVTLLYPAEECPFTGVEASLDVNDTKFALKKADGTVLALDEMTFWK